MSPEREPDVQAERAAKSDISPARRPIRRVARIEPPPVCAAPPVASGNLGTVLSWSESVEQAAVSAHDQGKLLFVMHVSGNFEQPGFT